jgi:SAM-dependent methyltransferase/uncharacterized protein YbaR (Trm112 family)
MKAEFLELLCDPATGADLQLIDPQVDGDEIVEGALRSSETGRNYPIVSGIPRFVPADNYCDSFGLQWNKYRKVQLDSANGYTFSKQRFENEVDWTAAQLDGQWVLDGGCGAGRFAEIAANYGAKVIALDFSTAVDAAAKNLGSLPNVHYIQGDLLNPPLKKQCLGFAYSLGVLQHTPDPCRALACILSLLGDGGRFAFTIYGRRWYTKLYSKYLCRPVTRRMPPQLLLRTIESVMPVAFPVTDLLFRVPALGKISQFAIPIANYVDKTDFSRSERYNEAVLDTFDMLAPRYDIPLTAKEVEGVLFENQVADFTFQSRVPVNVVGSVASRIMAAAASPCVFAHETERSDV